MKKIIFVCDSLRIGGIQTALVNLINNLNLENIKLIYFYLMMRILRRKLIVE